MHKLQRGTAPTCLAAYQQNGGHWEDVTPSHRKEIWSELDTMQVQRCAYCEVGISDKKRHIEHFQSRSRYPKLMFTWDNLFGSCDRKSSCGTHKEDKKRCGHYNPNDLVKPDKDDPEHFFLFVSDGSIAIRAGLTVREQCKAQETLRVFGLDANKGPLRHMRQRACAGYINTAEEFESLAKTYPEADWRPLLDEELRKIKCLPFATAIKHTLCG